MKDTFTNSAKKRPMSRVVAWLRALRLPFYPMSWLGYTVGCSLAVPVPKLWSVPAYWWGYVVVFLIEALTVFLNDLHDFESDDRNTNYGSFTGGSRVLVEGVLTPGDLRRDCKWVAVGAVLAAVILHTYSPLSPMVGLICILAALVLGVGYTVPPLKFSHRGWGEVVVAFAHSLLLVQCGALVVGGNMEVPGVIEVGMPLFFAILPSISLAGIPDSDADRQAGKSTLVVKFGIRPVVIIASLSAIAAFILALQWAEGWPAWALPAIALHACVVIASAISLWNRLESRRIDGVMIATLSYVLWFPTVPLFAKPHADSAATSRYEPEPAAANLTSVVKPVSARHVIRRTLSATMVSGIHEAEA
jgi:1,4-dihydroxy-2-naphthoate octaprenyltransferase